MKIKIASPCSARWEDMSGDERARFCQHCQKNVYNFASMTELEIQTLIREKEGNVCARIYQRQDGTILTSDCAVGVARIHRRIKIIVCSAAAAIVVSFGSLAAAESVDDLARERARLRALSLWDGTVWKIKGWLGIQPPVAVAGALPPIPVPQQPPTSCSTSNTLLGDVAPIR